MISDDEQKTASLLCNAAIEARVLGLPEPAMSITGSGAHGIIATMPLYAAYKVRGYSEEMLLRATALSYLVCMYIKEYSGKLSAFCGCAIAAGTGMACGLVLLRGGSTKTMAHTINNLASSITGMICDGGNQGCTMKGIVAVDAAWQMIFGVDTIPAYRRRGCAAMLLEYVIAEARRQGRKGLVLTCKDRLVHYYAKFGFVSEGISGSTHGDVTWYQMRLTF